MTPMNRVSRERWGLVPAGIALALRAACGSDGGDPGSTPGPDAGTGMEAAADDAGGDGTTAGPDGGADSGPGVPLPFITELVARNRTSLLDEDGAPSDWIEIFNPNAAPYDLGGHHLTDSKKDPAKWTFPPGTVVAPKGYLVVFASGKNRALAGKPLHASFSLSGGDGCTNRGGYLALTDKGGAPAQPVWDPYPAQLLDVSHGLVAGDPKAARAFFAKPTPGAPNDVASTLADRVVFTPASGTFAAGSSVSVTLKVASPTATIRYTTNRGRPIAVAGTRGTFTADATTDVLTLTGHGLSAGDPVTVSGPAPLVASMTYFVQRLGPDTFKLAMEPNGQPIDLTAGGSFEVRRDAAGATFATSDLLTTSAAHGFTSGDPVQVSTSGTMPGGVLAGTTYYAVVASATTLRLSASPALTPVVDVTSTGSGAHTVLRVPSPVYAGPIQVGVNTRIRARAYEPGHPDGPAVGEVYFALDAAAQAFTSTVPVVISHTWGASMPNNAPVASHVMLFEPKAPDNLTRLTNPPDLVTPGTLERHGSSTANDPKFSMGLEMQDEDGVDRDCSPFGMPLEADWLMHAPYFYDRSMIHNDLMYRLSNDAGRYAPRARLVEHIHNQVTSPDTIEGAITATDYFGVYSFMEKVSRGKDRVDVEKLTPTDNAPPTVQGGYMFKVDRTDPGELGLRPLPGQSFGSFPNSQLAWTYPKEISPDPFKVLSRAQSDYFLNYLGEAHAALFDTNPATGYAKYFDVPSLIDHHLLAIASKNIDALRHSAHWHKPRYGKIHAGPTWDFDRAMGSADGRDIDWGTWMGSGGNPVGGTDFFYFPWYGEMFLDPNFFQAWIDRLHVLRQGVLATATIHARIDELAAILNPKDGPDTPAKRSIARWPAVGTRGAGSNTAITNGLFIGTFPGEIAWLKYYFQKRLDFMDSQLTRPAVPSLPAGKVPAGSKVTFTSPSLAATDVKIYYTTDGTDPRGVQPGPNLSPGALEYTGPIPITGKTNLFVRTFDPATPGIPPGIGSSGVSTVPLGSGWSAPTVLSYSL